MVPCFICLAAMVSSSPSLVVLSSPLSSSLFTLAITHIHYLTADPRFIWAPWLVLQDQVYLIWTSREPKSSHVALSLHHTQITSILRCSIVAVTPWTNKYVVVVPFLEIVNNLAHVDIDGVEHRFATSSPDANSASVSYSIRVIKYYYEIVVSNLLQ